MVVWTEHVERAPSPSPEPVPEPSDFTIGVRILKRSASGPRGATSPTRSSRTTSSTGPPAHGQTLTVIYKVTGGRGRFPDQQFHDQRRQGLLPPGGAHWHILVRGDIDSQSDQRLERVAARHARPGLVRPRPGGSDCAGLNPTLRSRSKPRFRQRTQMPTRASATFSFMLILLSFRCPFEDLAETVTLVATVVIHGIKSTTQSGIEFNPATPRAYQ